ncbi:MAG: PfaD family polyunsaturated fatty acid/polyketide biosynthesis protein [Planctomycetota bacterium]
MKLQDQSRTEARRAPHGALPRPIGRWSGHEAPAAGPDALREALSALDRPCFLIDHHGDLAVQTSGQASLGDGSSEGSPLLAYVPPLPVSSLGDPAFRQEYGVRYAYMTGAMANGIASVELVDAVARHGMLGIFGAAGLSLERIAAAIDRLQKSLGDLPFGINLIHSPGEPIHEAKTVDLLLERGIDLIEASAFLDLTLPLVRYRLHGIHRDVHGDIVVPNRVIAKVSRVEVAEKFFSAPPEKMIARLVQSGELTEAQAELARQVPVAQDLTAEADSGGHTDNRPAITLLPTMIALRDAKQPSFPGWPLRVGAAGGIATPASTAAAFSLGAAYVVTGSVNQACVESGSSDVVRKLLAEASQADIAMAPAADMFEMGVKVQVLKRGTMFAMRAQRLFELYRAHDRLEDIPESERSQLEKTVFRAPIEDIWRQTRAYFEGLDPGQIERAERDPHHKMALVFRWYLGQTSRWANAGEAGRQIDYQVWCGPSMASFNEWTKGSFLAEPTARRVTTVAGNLLVGAAYTLRARSLELQGLRLPPSVAATRPHQPAELDRLLDSPVSFQKP